MPQRACSGHRVSKPSPSSSPQVNPCSPRGEGIGRRARRMAVGQRRRRRIRRGGCRRRRGWRSRRCPAGPAGTADGCGATAASADPAGRVSAQAWLAVTAVPKGEGPLRCCGPGMSTCRDERSGWFHDVTTRYRLELEGRGAAPVLRARDVDLSRRTVRLVPRRNYPVPLRTRPRNPNHGISVAICLTRRCSSFRKMIPRGNFGLRERGPEIPIMVFR